MFYIRLFLCLFTLNSTADNLYNFNSDTDELRFNSLIKDIRCPKCTSGSLASSNAPISEDLKIKIIDMINEGRSDQEIKDYISLRFGSESLFQPEISTRTYILWFSPFIFLLIALLAFMMRRK